VGQVCEHRTGRFPTSEQVEWMFEGIFGDVEVVRRSIDDKTYPKRPSRRGLRGGRRLS